MQIRTYDQADLLGLSFAYQKRKGQHGRFRFHCGRRCSTFARSRRGCKNGEGHEGSGKGDGGNGLFIQITSDDREDYPIPDSPGKDASTITFGILKAAQALGDLEALKNTGRRVIRFHLKGDVVKGIKQMTDWVG